MQRPTSGGRKAIQRCALCGGEPSQPSSSTESRARGAASMRCPLPHQDPLQFPLHQLLQPCPTHPIHSSNIIYIPGTDVGPGASPVIKRLRTLSLALTVQGKLEMLELRILKPAAGASLMEKVMLEETCEGRGGWPCGSSVKSLLDRGAGQGRAARWVCDWEWEGVQSG